MEHSQKFSVIKPLDIVGVFLRKESRFQERQRKIVRQIVEVNTISREDTFIFMNFFDEICTAAFNY